MFAKAATKLWRDQDCFVNIEAKSEVKIIKKLQLGSIQCMRTQKIALA